MPPELYTMTSKPLNPRLEKLIRVAPSIKKELWLNEPELTKTKWYDHRMDDPVTATEKFAELYVKAFREFHEQYRDSIEAHLKKPIKSTVLSELPASEITALWKARQAADRSGLQYYTYLNVAFRVLYERGCKRFPRPNQLYSEPVTEEAKRVAGGVTGPILNSVEDERYLSNHYQEYPAQDDLLRALIEKSTGEGDQSILASNASIAIYDTNIFPEYIAEEKLDPVVFKLAKQDFLDGYRNPRKPSKEFLAPDFDYTCFGVPHIPAENEYCTNCSRQKDCLELRASVEAGIQISHGSFDPKAENKKKQARERKRRQRAREKAAAMEIS